MRRVLLTAAMTMLASAALAQTAPSGDGTRGLRRLPNPGAPTTTATPPPAPSEPAPAPAVCNRAFPKADLVFTDQADFDRDLNKLLVATPDRVVVDVAAPFDPDQPPKAVGAWLAEIQRTGGQVSRREIGCGRGFGSLFKALKQLLGFGAPQNLLAPAKDYDATLWFEKTSGKVTQVQFQKRQPPVAG